MKTILKAFVNSLEIELAQHANPNIALEQKAYMRNQFEFYGIKSTKRREIQIPFLMKEFLPKKDDLVELMKVFWEKPQRDFQYFSQEFALKYLNQLEKQDIELFEYMITQKSWWDTVDFIAAKLMGEYFKKFPEQRDLYIKKWINSNNIWLQRCTLLFQLKYKENLDTFLLESIINSLLGSKEFFINKAIGWILREFSKTNPNWVIEFTGKTKLSNLSRREALRLIG